MSARYTADGRRKSSMVHATRGHECAFCDVVAFGNGGTVAHSRAHVRRGEAVELVKHYDGFAGCSRLFLAVGDERIERYLSDGFERVA